MQEPSEGDQVIKTPSGASHFFFTGISRCCFNFTALVRLCLRVFIHSSSECHMSLVDLLPMSFVWW